MRYQKFLVKLCSIFGLAAALGVASAPAVAVPLPPSLSVPSAGESDLGSYAMPRPGENITIDWMVVDAALFGFAGEFAYLYQVENTTLAANEIDLFTVSFDASVSISAAGYIQADLDVAFPGLHGGHDAGTFAYLLGEEESFDFFSTSQIVTNINPTNVSWMWALSEYLPKGAESDLLWLVSPVAPGYVVGQVANTSPPSPWGSLAANSDMVVGPGTALVPVPEPGALTMFGIGLLVAGASLRGTRR